MDSYGGGQYYDPMGGGWTQGGSEGYSQSFTQDGNPIYSNPARETGSQGGTGSQIPSPSVDHYDEVPEVREEIDEIKGADYYKWTHEEEVELVEAMKVAKLANHKSPQGFKKTGWPCMLAHMKMKFPATKLTEGNIMNHVKTWRKLFIGVLELKSQSGTGWCAVTNSFDCTPEAWKEACKKHGKLMLGKRKKNWEFFPQWADIYGTDRAAGKKVVDFHTAAMKVLAHDRYKSLVVDNLTVNEDGVVQTSSNHPDASDSTNTSKRKRRSGVDVDAEFFAHMKTMVGAPTGSESGNGKDLRASRIHTLDADLKTFPHLMPDARIAIGDIIASGQGKLEHFYSLSQEDREIYIKLELVKMGKPTW